MKADNREIMSPSLLTAEESQAFVAGRLRELLATDAQFRDAMPHESVIEAKMRPGLGLAQIVAACMEGYSERPALAQRAFRVGKNPDCGRSCRQLLDHFETISYRDLWSRSRALANFWYHDPDRHLRADEFLCIIAFAGTEFATVDLAAIHNGAVVVPMQTNAQPQQLLGIIKEVEPRWLATSIECLETSVNLVLNGHRPVGVLVFDYRPEVDSEREAFEKAQSELAAAGLPDLLVTIDTACQQGGALPAAPLYVAQDTDQRLCTIYYTSGSTGLPKGAMYPERMLKDSWRIQAPIPFIYMHYMPMNHSFGRSGVFMTLAMGGTCYFTAKSDLSTIFNDIREVRPTMMGVVPRICEMIYQRYKVELEHRAGETRDPEALLLEVRNEVLGGRLLAGSFGSAPLAPELRVFMEQCLGFKLDDSYGATEVQGVLRNNRILRPPVIDYRLVDVPELGYFRTDKPYPRGELLVKTEHVMLGYYKRPDVTESVFDQDGYYKTGDIMAEIGPDQLVYVDRRNNVQKLSQGEFVAIALMETLYTNGHPLIRQAYLYGSSERAFLVGVIVPNPDIMQQMGIEGDDRAVKAAIREAINEVARRENLNAHEVPRDFLVEYEPFSVDNGLLAGIGKYQRPKFRERYGARLEALYEAIADSQERDLLLLRREGRDLPVLETVGRAVKATLGLEDIDVAKRCSFIELGGDSLAALACSVLLEEIYDIEVPASVINNPAGSLQQLAHYIERARDASFDHATVTSVHGKNAAEIRASDLSLEKFMDQGTLQAAADLPAPGREIHTVLVTGANGYLGRFLCLEWLERMARVGGKVVCIARGEDDAAARTRIESVFDSGDTALLGHFGELAAEHLEVLAGDLGEPRLGLASADWRRLAESVDHIVHPAAFVNHVLPYAQLFGPNVVGTAELIRLAITHHLKSIDNVSTVAAAMLPDGGVMDEYEDVRSVTPSRKLDDSRYADGYANSKWAGEVLLRDAHERFGLPVSVFRSDMILAHSVYKGQLNVPDMFTRWLFSTVVTGLAPASYYQRDDAIRPHYDGLPVDFTAAAIATLGESTRDGYRCYHVVNPHDDGICMDTFVDWAIEAGCAIDRVDDYDDWFIRFETALRTLPEKQRQQSSLPLLHQLRHPMPAQAGATVSARQFHADVRRFAVGRDRDIPHLSSGFIRKCLDDLRQVGMVEGLAKTA